MFRNILRTTAQFLAIAILIGFIAIIRYGFITDCPNTVGIYVYCEPRN